MFGSQAIETGIGLTVLFFVVATAASTIVEVISRWLGKRAKNLEAAVAGMFQGEGSSSTGDLLTAFKNTSIYRAAETAAGRSVFSRLTNRTKRPSYLSARSFADAVTELLVQRDANGVATVTPIGSLPRNLRKRLDGIVREAGDDLVAIKSGLERWFDETMEHVEGAYKRWVTLVLFLVGLVITVAGNISTIHVAEQLWTDPVTRQAVVAAADNVSENTELDSVADTTDTLAALQLPVGYRSCSAEQEDCDEFSWQEFDARIWAVTFAGWLLTAVLVMLGGPFWFDLLNKLVSLRSTGAKPPPAPADPSSATHAQLNRPPVVGGPGQPAAGQPAAGQAAATQEAATQESPAPMSVQVALDRALDVGRPQR